MEHNSTATHNNVDLSLGLIKRDIKDLQKITESLEDSIEKADSTYLKAESIGNLKDTISTLDSSVRDLSKEVNELKKSAVLYGLVTKGFLAFCGLILTMVVTGIVTLLFR